MRISVVAFVAVLLTLVAAHAETQPKADPWARWQFLEGQWIGVGEGKPGEATGSFSFQFDLQKKVLVRKNHTEYPASKERPAFVHEDLMVVYPDPAGKGVRAIYFDNEGHVINYDAVAAEDGGSWTFTSDAAADAPRFRLTYKKEKDGAVSITFEIAPPGKDFMVYLKGAAHRRMIDRH